MNNKYLEEIEPSYSMLTIMEEAERCLLCLDAPCSKACPAGTDPAAFIRSVRFRNFKGAAETIRENNALGAVCALVCPTEKYCEMGCARSQIDKPINIGGIQKFVTDFEQQTEMEILKKGESNGKKIAIIGSGPSGLQSAASLLQLGYDVTIYEKSEQAGGYLRYGIPEYRLPNAIVNYEILRIANLGAEFIFNTTIGDDITIDELKEQYDAVIVAIGASQGKIIDLFEGNSACETAVSFLSRARDNQGAIDLPNDALVIGGGDVAMDVVTSLKLLGVERVTDVVYEEFCEFKASKKELEGAQNQGVTIIDGYYPVAVDGNRVTFKHRHLNNELAVEAEKIILAVGQEVDAKNLNIEIKNNQVLTPGFKTDDKKVFVTGDIVHGDMTVVWAVKKGKEVAAEIHEFLGGNN
ncbi:FAD-dependent oxidoreductase [Vagococcus carniphilus]|uniref:dihydrouracil dehydrogenase (NAD(+)) n=1 Tax=Vagococcus carniphilus TaxID=218144 RepID=A0A430B1R3_9ENTE|nr:FAD-dependent oxidoreductase [Vagococcus carniphilus]MDT2815607.1 FAD-dependent oxidoreductase [Vagococcus carniphilus]MDT2848512.1 FAD-dependent oxidoreductase [Vagococcus carniphilus]QNN73970.1 FAD-dependent oxidoreductase [Vagococcus carniphilus]RSU14248.1 dihydropyrimidine dehydrogenase [Vagococcus carniphilus]